MTFADLLLAAQLMSEERVGAKVRSHQRSVAADEAAKLERLSRSR